LRSAAMRVAAGGSIGQEARELNRLGLLTPTGKRWESGTLRRALCAPRIAGLRSYQGKVVGPASWPAIIDEETWHRLCVMADGRKRGRSTASKWLLSALIECPKCGRHLYGNGPAYGCHQSNAAACGGASISVRHADAKVTAAIDEYLNDPRVTLWLEQAGKPIDLGAEVSAIEQKRVDLARRWALDEITLDAYDTARQVLDIRLAALGDLTPVRPSIDIEELRDAWATGSTPLRRNVITALVETPMRLRPERMSNPGDRLIVEFREG
jgi:site-specific DNA recombinase